MGHMTLFCNPFRRLKWVKMTLLGFRTTADRGKIKDFPKLPLATSFIRKALYEMAAGKYDE